MRLRLRDRDHYPAAGVADPGGGGRRRARPDACGGRLEIGVGPGGNLLGIRGFRGWTAPRAHGTAVPPSPYSSSTPGPGVRCRAATGSIRPIPVWLTASGRRRWQLTARGAPARQAMGLMLFAHSAPTGGLARTVAARHSAADDRRLSRKRCRLGRAPRILASRTVFVADDRSEALGTGGDRSRTATSAFCRDGAGGVCRGYVGPRPDRGDGHP